jgi:hypothetical protein
MRGVGGPLKGTDRAIEEMSEQLPPQSLKLVRDVICAGQAVVLEGHLVEVFP